ncbi:uncharacterized protein KIAA2026 isoform X2 [Sphaeramia orbicularis]|uniref:uncharacterized protein KIAA2026 isoform X2 n=2 Tax=Sphaeramia orbicularis TaxID=375764 RepID=UPI0011815A67|nr:uncharacterized protein KIAA2026 homolog isoform X2 [Sphaeramia orbicularis]
MSAMDEEPVSDPLSAACIQPVFSSQDLPDPHSASQQPPSVFMPSESTWMSSSTDDLGLTEELSNGTCEIETMVALHCPGDREDVVAEGDPLALSNDGMSEFSNSDISLPEVCISTNSNSFEEDMNYEVQQAYRIFTGFLLDKNKTITSPFLHPIGHQEAQHGIGGVRNRGHAHLRQSMCLRRIEEKFISQEYESITEFVADFRLMLENCYRYHGVDHWISKQAQKLEIMLEQKLTLLSRTLRQKTTLAVTSKGRFGVEEERVSGGTSTRRRLAPRSLATITVGGHESVMVQTLRLEEQQRAKEERRQRELEKKEAEEMSAKEVEEWEQSLLSQASPYTVDTLWELPAIGHFLCLAQTALNLPEIIFFELERCLLMPRCSLLLSKIMSSLLSPPQKRSTLHRRPALPYRRWESELRQRVMGWYQTIGACYDQPGRAEQLGLCHQFFSILGEVSPLEEKPFHLLPFYQRVWLLKGLCDHVYETQKDVQDAVLAQPIHECRESILGYDSKENAYIHFPHFCGADLRIYCQSPSTPPAFPFPSVLVKRVEVKRGTEGKESSTVKVEGEKSDVGHFGGSLGTGDSADHGMGRAETQRFTKEKAEGEEDDETFSLWSLKKEEESSDGDSCEDFDRHTNTLSISPTSPIRRSDVKNNLKRERVELEHQSKRLKLKQEPGFSLGSICIMNTVTQEPCLSVVEHSYTGRSPTQPVKAHGQSPTQGHQRSSCSECCKSKIGNIKSEPLECGYGTSGPATQLSSESTQNSSEERAYDRIWTKKKKRKKKRGSEQLLGVKREYKQLQQVDRMSMSAAEGAKSAIQQGSTANKRKDKKKKHKAGKKLQTSKKIKDEPPLEPSFKLVCTSLEELRELISKTEDELDDLESTKKRLGRWYYRREAVKDLHSTLIRLLNELSPWEPKLIKAYQRNRLRLKKEFEVFKKHPEYNNFVREECISSSSDDDEERVLGKEVCLLTEQYRRSEEEDLEHVVPRGLWTGGSTREFGTESAGETTMTYITPNHLKIPLASPDKGVSLLPRPQTGTSNSSSTPDSELQSRSELIHSDQSSNSNSAWASRIPAQTTVSPKPPILHLTTGLPKGYTPIPTLLAKSVGNKVTLMKRPAECLGVNSINGQSKRPVVSSLPTSAVDTTKLSKAQSSSSSSQQNAQQSQAQGQVKQTPTVPQPGLATMMAAPPKSPQTKPSQTLPKTVQVVYKVPEGLGHLVRKDSSSPVKISVHPAVDQNAGERIMQQVVILPSNLLIKKTEEKSLLHQQQSKRVQDPVPEVATSLCMSTNVPGFTIPENRIPIQQVAPLKDARTVRTSSPSVSPGLQQTAINTAGFKGTLPRSLQTTTSQCIPNHSPVMTPASAVYTDPAKSTDPKQELKTVCIRDSQSILVTTRGGNTGIVKVQTSSDQNALGSLPTSPIITISPQFKAFLVSKTSPTLCPSIPAQTSSCTIPALTSISVAQTQRQVPSVLKSPSTVRLPMVTSVTGSIPVTAQVSQSVDSTVALTQGSKISASCTESTKSALLTQTAGSGSCLQPSLVKNAVVVPSLTNSGASQGATAAEFISKPFVKRTSTDEMSQVTKFILVTPSSSTSSSMVGVSSTKTLPGSQVMFIGQPTVTSSMTVMQSSKAVPKQVVAAAPSGQRLATPLSSEKMGVSPSQCVSSLNSEPLSKAKNITLPSGVHIQFSGQTTTIGQTIGVLSRSPSKNRVSNSDSGQKPISTGQITVPSSNIISSRSSLLASHTSPPTASNPQGMSSFSVISKPVSSTTTSSATVDSFPAGDTSKKNPGLSTDTLASECHAHVTTSVQSSPFQNSIPAMVHHSPNIQSGITPKTSMLPSLQFPLNKTQAQIYSATTKPTSTTGDLLSSSTTASTPVTTSATGTIQQKIVINTTTPLAAGTHIVLNNAHFVVPPQGLSPGTHVLIISSPAAQQVPSTSAVTTGAAAVPLQGVSHVTVAPQASVLPQSPTRLPSVPAISSPFVACTPALGPPLVAASPSVTPVQLTGATGLSSTLLASKTNVVSALPRLPALQAVNIASAPTVVSALPRLDGAGLVSPVTTSSSAVVSQPAVVRAVAGTATQGECLSAISATLALPSPRLSAPALSSVVLPNPSAVSLLSPNPAPTSSVAPSLYPSSLNPQVVSATAVRPQQTAVQAAAPSTAPSQALLHMGLGNTSVRKPPPAVLHPVLSGARAQVLPTVAVPPIVSTVSRMQTLPIATVPPIGSTVNRLESAPIVCMPLTSSTVIVTASQPMTALETNDSIHPPAVLSGSALGKHSVQTSALSMHTSVASKLLISPDGAVLSTDQCQVGPKPKAALVVSPNSSTAALHTRDSSLQPSQMNTK